MRGALGALVVMRLVVNSAHRLIYPFLPVIARGLGVSLDQAGLMVSARWAVGLGTPAIVTFAGRGERRRRLIGLGLVLFALGAAVTAATNVYLGALVGFALMGIAKPLFDVAAQAYLADRVPYASRARYLGTFELTWAGGLLIGAPLAGWMISAAGWRAPFWAIAVLSLAGFFLAGRVLAPDVPEPTGSRARLRWDAPAVAFMGVVALFSAAAELVFVVLGAWLEGSFGLSVITLGGTATLIALAELGGEGGVAGFADRIGKRATVAIGMTVAALGFVGIAMFASSLALGLAATMVAYLGFEVSIVGSIPLASELRPRARSRFLAWMVVAMALGRTIGAAAGTRVFAAHGVGGAALAAAVANVLALVVFLAVARAFPADDATDVS